MSNVGDFEWIWEFWSHVLAVARKLLLWYPIHQNIVIFLVIPRLKYLSAIWLQFICSNLLVSHTSFFFCHRLHKMDSFDILISLPWLGLGAYLGATVFKRPKYNRKTIHVITIVINDCLHHDCHDDDCVRKRWHLESLAAVQEWNIQPSIMAKFNIEQHPHHGAIWWGWGWSHHKVCNIS